MVAVTFPLNLIDTKVFWTRSFRLRVRQEFSRIAGGGAIRKELGSPVWWAQYVSRTLKPSEIDIYRSRLDLLEGGMQKFYGLNPSRCRPILYPSSNNVFPDFSGTGSLLSIAANNKEIAINGLPVGYMISAGDMLQIGDTDLYTVGRGAVAETGGIAYDVEVRPHLWTTSTVGLPVKLYRPTCLMAIDPAEVSIDVSPDTGKGTISFAAWEAR